MKKSVITAIFLPLIAFASPNDSLHFGYFDYGSYELISTHLNFSRNDSLSAINLTGRRTETFYDSYTKEDMGLGGEISVRHGMMRYGIILSSDYISNNSISRPTQSNIRILPMAGLSRDGFDITAAFGYIGKTDEIEQKTGGAVYLDGKYSAGSEQDRFSANGSFRGDDTDDKYNYGSGASFIYSRPLRQSSGSISAGGTGDFSQYHYSDLESSKFMIKRYEYDVFAGLDYNATQALKNSAKVSFYARNRDSFRDEEGTGYNYNSNLKLSDEIVYFLNRITVSFQTEFDTGSDKFSSDIEKDAEKSLSYYNLALSPNISFKKNDYLFSLNGRYVKHEYKSLTVSNLEDRDIIKMTLSPEVSYAKSGRFSVAQSFPLEFYKLVNISSQRSVNNYIDRAVASNTDIRYDFNRDLYLTKNLKFRTYYRSYDYDETFSSSFVRKNYSVSDTLSYRFSADTASKLSAKYTYEEFGGFNYSNFTENPVNFRNHYYSSLSFYFRFLAGLNLRTEYYFYETDMFDFDQEDFSKNNLSNVYISHGPKVGLELRKNGFYLFSGLEIENYRKGENLTKFRIESSLSFK